jgi:hypothetical protein
LIRLAPIPPCYDDTWAREWESRRARPRGTIGRLIMPAFSPALITIMRAVLEEAMTKVPAEQATTVTKAYLAEFILKAAAEGVSYRPSFRCFRDTKSSLRWAQTSPTTVDKKR